ncbi:MAG: hypothetical protein ACUVTL_09400 [Thermoproteota archaeon]
MRIRLACAGSLPPMGDPERYPFSHIEFWLKRQIMLQYSIVGTGEPGGRNRYGLVERFTQNMDGIEIRLIGSNAKSYCVGRIRPNLNLDSMEIIEAKYLAKIAPSDVLKKATITDPVTIGFELIANDPHLFRSYPEIYEDVAKAIEPIVRAISDYVDIVQFDCPSHLARPIREPWRYVNELLRSVNKRSWLHIDGDLSGLFPTLVKEYDVDVLNINLHGREEDKNFAMIEKFWKMMNEEGKKLAPAIVNTQIRDEMQQIDTTETIYSRIKRLSSILSFDMIEAFTPGCGLRILQSTAQTILSRLQEAVEIFNRNFY